MERSECNKRISEGRLKLVDPEKRREIAKNANLARWAKQGKFNGDIQESQCEGPLFLLEHEIPCAVLKNGKRVLTQNAMLKTLGKSTGGVEGAQELPVFLRSNALKPLLTQEIIQRSTPIVFKSLKGNLALGYEADFLVDICNLFLEAREKGLLKTNQMHIASQCEALIRAFAKVGLISLIDEATGFQKERKRDALSEMLKIYLTEEMQRWSKVFSYEFYENIFRLKRKSMNSLRNAGWLGHVTNNLVYSRLAPGVFEELQIINPKKDGKRKGCHHQFFNQQEGILKLSSHLDKLNTIMRGFDDWDSFENFLNRSLPKFREAPDPRQIVMDI